MELIYEGVDKSDTLFVTMNYKVANRYRQNRDRLSAISLKFDIYETVHSTPTTLQHDSWKVL